MLPSCGINLENFERQRGYLKKHQITSEIQALDIAMVTSKKPLYVYAMEVYIMK